MNVYLDSANIFDACKDALLLARLQALAAKGVRFVFGPPHLVDLSGLETAQDVLLAAASMARLHGAEWWVAGQSLCALELAVLDRSNGNAGRRGLPEPAQPIEMSWGTIANEFQHSPEAAMETLSTLRGLVTSMHSAREYARKAEILAPSHGRTSFQKTLFKYVEGRASTRDMDFAERRHSQSSLATYGSLDEALNAAGLALNQIQQTLLLVKITRPDQTEALQESILEPLASLVEAMRSAEEAELAGMVGDQTDLVREIARRIADLARTLFTFGQPDTFAAGAEGRPWYREFEIYLETAVATGLLERRNTDAKEPLFRRWLESSRSTCRSGHLLARARIVRASRTGMKDSVSDLADLEHLAILPYVDVLFADKRTFELVRQMRDDFPEYLPRVRRNSELVRWLTEMEQSYQPAV